MDPSTRQDVARTGLGPTLAGEGGARSETRRRSKSHGSVQYAEAIRHAGSPGASAGVAALPATSVAGITSVGSESAPLALRALEIAVALLALTLSAPAMLVLALIVRRGTPGPALFWQERVGVNRETFQFVKFRTLYADARQRFPDLYAYRYTPEELERLRFKIQRDPRVTPQGRWLRRSTLDELPNFWNLLTGDMALVGPRPEIPEMLPYYRGTMLLKFTVRPGITGLTQVSGRGRLGFHETVALDVEYVQKRSFWLDLRILCRTVKIVLFGDGAF